MKRWLPMAATISSCLLALASGCGTAAVSGPAVQGVRASGQSYSYIQGPRFGEGTAADRRRGFFDFWNEQVIRNQRAVSTVFMGDSITELWDLQVYFTPQGGLIENRGISGDLAVHMEKRFEADVLQLRPQNVVILAGTNDVRHLLDQGKSEDEVMDSITAAVVSMMDQARTAGINTLVCSILPTNSDYSRHADRTWLRAKINERIRAACADKGCIYVDYAAHTSDANGDLRKDLARDGLHPHYAGYDIMARVLKETAAAHGLRL